MAVVAGVDSSTQSTKVLLVDAADGTVLATGRAPHAVHGTGGARETDPDVWWEALRAALAATGMAREVRAISVAAQQHGLVVQDSAGRPLREAVLWNDTRSAPDAAALVDQHGGGDAWAERIGVVPVPAITIAKWAWLRRTEPDRARAVAGVRLPHDHLTERLVGRSVTDRGDASGSGWWSTRTERYDGALLEAVGLDVSMLPEVLAPDAVAGTVRRDVADLLGLPPDAVVGPGTGDNMAAALGLALAEGEVAISLGTSGTIFTVSALRTVDETGTVAGFADATGRFLPLACTLNCTLAVDRIAGWLGLDRDDISGRTRCVVLPYLDGERTPNLPHMAGSILGLRHDSTPQEILRAAYEGAVETLLTAADGLGAAGASLAADAPLMLIGGGSRGAAWRQVVSALSGRRLHLPDEDELVARGAAAQAAAVLEGSRPDAVAHRWGTPTGDVVQPEDRSDAPERLAAIRAARAALRDLRS